MLGFIQIALDNFFIFGELPDTVETGTYILSLVLLSYVIASLGSYMGLRLASDMYKATSEKHKVYLHIGGAIAFGTGIWSMHFIGMLAYDMDMVHTYDPFLTFLSALIAVVIAYGVLQIIRAGELTTLKLSLGAVLLGTAICSMHYIGMAAMNMDADLYYKPFMFVASVLIAVAASGAALWIVFTLTKHTGKEKSMRQIIAALIMGAAVSGMHYVGMEAAVFIPHANCRYDPDQSFGALALIVTVVSSVIFVVAIIMSLYKNTDVKFTEEKSAYSGNKIFIQLSVLLSAFIVLFIGSYVFLVNDIEEQEQNTIILNAVGLQRTIIARQIEKIEFPDNRQQLDSSVRLVDANYKSLLNGGILTYSSDGSNIKNISSFEDDQIKAVLLSALTEWTKLQQLAPKHSNFSAQYFATLQAQDIAVNELQSYIQRKSSAIAFKQQAIIGIGVVIFLFTVLYVRFAIANPIEQVGLDLKKSRKNLEQRVEDQTKILRESKEEAERLNGHMQVYTDKLEEARLEQMEMNDKLEHEAETVKLFEKVSAAINLSETIDGAIQTCINMVCEYADWSVGHAYTFDDEQAVLVPKKIWYLSDEVKFQDFKEVTENTTFLPGIGLPGRVYESGHSAWISDLSKDKNFPRLAMLKDTTVKAGVAFPVLVKKECVAVLEFFFEDVKAMDEDLLRVMGNIGMQVGRIVEREEMQEARYAAERANKAKGDFLANMSHELRTPLNSIIGLSRMLVDDAEEKSEEEDMNRVVYKSASNLLEIVNDILDLSKIDAGEIILEKIGFDFKDVLSGIIESLSPIASTKGISLNYSYNNQSIPFLEGDPVRLGRILTNLIGNAIKYTEVGTVDVNIECSTDSKNQAEIVCSVIDTGIGIPQEKFPVIFQKFSQADETTTRKFGGTGLGLSITKELVEMMGGSIEVDSTLGVGSTFMFWVKFDIVDEVHNELKSNTILNVEHEYRADRIDINDAKVLVAEDHELNQAFIKKLLRKLGFADFDLVDNGLLAVEAFKSGKYDFVLMDCHMPEMNGYQATGEIRKLENPEDSRIPIFALTADAMAGAKEKCLLAGMDDYLTKPIDIDKFRLKLSNWFNFSSEPVVENDTSETIDNNGRFDLSSLKDYTDSYEEMQDFCNTFFAKTEEAIQGLRKECSDGVNQAWVEITHQIKGSSGMIGVLDLQDICADAQLMEDSTKLKRENQLGKIEKSYEISRKFLEQFLKEEAK